MTGLPSHKGLVSRGLYQIQKLFMKSIKKSLVIIFGLVPAIHAFTQVPTDSVSIMTLDQLLPSRSQLGGLTVDRLGYIYVANFLDKVWKVSPEGKVTLLTDGLYGASGNTLDALGNLYQSNFFANTITKIDRFGNISTYAEKDLNGPVGLAFDNENNLFVCNCSNNTILKISPQGISSTFADGEFFNCPNGISIDDNNNLIVVNFNSDEVIKISPEGTAGILSTIPGGGGNAHIVFYNDNYYISKIKTGQVFRMTPTGTYQLLAGTGQIKDEAGPGLQASFANPNGIGVNAQTGTLYVNTLVGEWTSQKPSTLSISEIKLLTLPQLLNHYLDKNDIEGAKSAFWAYKNDPQHVHENLAPAMAGLAWRNMANRKIPTAIALFHLTAEAYPDNWRSHYNLGEVYSIISQPEKAIEYYEKALEKDPQNAMVNGKLKALKK